MYIHMHMHTCIYISPQLVHARLWNGVAASCHGSYCELILSLVRTSCRLSFAARSTAVSTKSVALVWSRLSALFNLEIISKNFQFSTRRTRILMWLIISTCYYMVLIVNPMGRILVRCKNLDMNSRFLATLSAIVCIYKELNLRLKYLFTKS